MSAPGHILVVCTANICRSPMGAALLRHALAAQPEPWRSLPVVSAGIYARDGEPVSENSVVALRKVGIDIAGQVSQPVTQALLDDALMVLVMTESHRALLLVQAEPPPAHLYLFREFLPLEDKEISDPYGGPLKVYERCRDELVEAIPSLVAQLKTLRPAGGR
ncbi:MAG: low molecular weight protein arginine phosphatase [Opitutales bacterium]